MTYENIKFEKEDGIAIITLSRPQALNTLSYALTAEFDDALDKIEKDDSINAFIVTGGPRADGRPCFCAGGDLKDMPSTPRRKAEDQAIATIDAIVTGKSAREGPGSTTVMEDLNKCAKLSIAAVDGICTAGGLEIALGCDIILASETAQFSDLHLKNLGKVGGAASSTKLARRVGVSKAIQLCCTGDVIDGKEAHRIHLADEVYAPAQLLPSAKEMAKKIAGMRPAGIRLTRAVCKAIYDMDYNTSMRFQDAAWAVLDFGADQWRAQRWGGKR